ncbi:hypothetical protein [Streptomyces niveus]|uniref:hypothetical protein n=1 Tax=Streptomyces niveus TaxID=193462 RepID=UPI00362ADC07
MGALEPINEKTSKEGRELAEALRTLFQSLDISIRRYAVRCRTDPGNVSRYLSGARVPPWSFVKELLTRVAEHREQETKDETFALLRRLYTRALGSGNNTRRVLELQRLLEEADQQVLENKALEKVIRQTLQQQQHQISELTAELQSAQAVRAADRLDPVYGIEKYQGENEELRAERNHLQDEVALLKRQLAEVSAARILAEERCEVLERQIEDAEGQEREAERTKADLERRRLEHEAEKAAAEYASAQKKIRQLQFELEEANKEKPQYSPTIYSSVPIYTSKGTEKNYSEASTRVGYNPPQVLRRVYAAHRTNPANVEQILRTAVDLQTREEISTTRELLYSLSSEIVLSFDRLVRARTPKARVRITALDIPKYS